MLIHIFDRLFLFLWLFLFFGSFDNSCLDCDDNLLERLDEEENTHNEGVHIIACISEEDSAWIGLSVSCEVQNCTEDRSIACDKIVANDAPQIGVLITKRRIGAKIPTFNTKETTWNTAYVTDFPSARITPDETKKIILNMQPPVIGLM